MKLKSVVSIALLLAMAAGIAGCNAKPASTSLPPTASVSESETKKDKDKSDETTASETKESESSESKKPGESGASETTKAAETTKETTKSSDETTETTKAPAKKYNYRAVKITNAYKRTFKVGKKKVNTAYPKITVKGKSTKAVNNEIAKQFKSIAKKNTSRVYYSYWICKSFVSILVTVELKAGDSSKNNYYVYNVSRITGKKMTRKNMLDRFGYTNAKLNNKVKTGIKRFWRGILAVDKSAATKKLYENSLTNKKIKSAMPYMNKNGKRCYLVRQIKLPGSSGYYDLTDYC